MVAAINQTTVRCPFEGCEELLAVTVSAQVKPDRKGRLDTYITLSEKLPDETRDHLFEHEEDVWTICVGITDDAGDIKADFIT